MFEPDVPKCKKLSLVRTASPSTIVTSVIASPVELTPPETDVTTLLPFSVIMFASKVPVLISKDRFEPVFSHLLLELLYTIKSPPAKLVNSTLLSVPPSVEPRFTLTNSLPFSAPPVEALTTAATCILELGAEGFVDVNSPLLAEADANQSIVPAVPRDVVSISPTAPNHTEYPNSPFDIA